MGRTLCLTTLALLLSDPLRSQTELTPLIRELRAAVQDDSLASASEIANRLDEAVQRQYSGWLIHDSRERIRDVLQWLPRDVESFWVNQEPFKIEPEQSVQLLYGRPALVYSVDRLMSLNGGAFYKSLANRTVRLVMAATKNIGPEDRAVPGVIGAQDVAYFYFFDGPVHLPPADERIQGHSAWKGTAVIDSGAPFEPGVKREQREDENWIILPRPDLLIVANRHEMLNRILEQMSAGSKTRALPDDLPEWTQVNQSAPFWGLRHYSAQSKPKPGEQGYDAAELPRPDGSAQGITVQFDTANQKLEVRYLSTAPVAEGQLVGQFKIQHSEPQVWKLVSDIQDRGPWPVHFAMSMLGFGEYR